MLSPGDVPSFGGTNDTRWVGTVRILSCTLGLSVPWAGDTAFWLWALASLSVVAGLVLMALEAAAVPPGSLTRQEERKRKDTEGQSAGIVWKLHSANSYTPPPGINCHVAIERG